jgi:pyruvyltransferase
MSKKSYKIWWIDRDKNFGDLLTPCIFDYFGIQYEYSELSSADTICVGSIARHAGENFTVLGSGIVNQKKEKLNPKAIWKFARGPYTRKKIIEQGGSCPEIYGDPGLLLPLLCEESKKEFDIAIVPHFMHYEYVKEKFNKFKIINVVNNDPLEVCKEITKCRHVLSSSLHGIIAAHAYYIPVARLNFPINIKGDGIKFEDHYSSLDLNSKISTIDDPKFTIPKNINYNSIINIFKELKE